ncbi:MAG: DedA family protein [Bacteroidales bacterium]|nr:DedA family protein [Bacteroidales bacterium]
MNIFQYTRNWFVRCINSPFIFSIIFLGAAIESTLFPFTLLYFFIVALKPVFAYRFALISTIGALFGALACYHVGYSAWFEQNETYSSFARFFFDHVPGFTYESFHKIQEMYKNWGVFFIFIAAFTPIPFELATITSGIFEINIVLFIVTTIAGRGARFFLIAFLFYRFGSEIKTLAQKYLRFISIGLASTAGLVFLLIKLFN